MSPLTIKQTLLRVLAHAKPYAVPFETLHAEVNRLVRPELSADELKTHLRALLDASMVNYLPDDLDKTNEDARRWFIREAGEAALRQ